MHDSSVESTGATATPTKTISSGVSIANSAGSISGGRRPGRRGEGTCVWAELAAERTWKFFAPKRKVYVPCRLTKFLNLYSYSPWCSTSDCTSQLTHPARHAPKTW